MELAAEGCGTLSRPWMIKREALAKAIGEAEARRIERLAQEQLREDIRDVRAGRKTIGQDFRLIEGPGSDAVASHELRQIKADYLDSLRGRGYAPQHLHELERQINLDQISSLAIEEATADEDATADDKAVDPDWFTHWRNRAQDVSNQDMQRLWARILTGQAKTAGSYSVHTLEFLSRMSRDDAELIAKLGQFALDGRGVAGATFDGRRASLASAGVTLDHLLYLSDLGILGGVTGFTTVSLRLPFREDQTYQRHATVRCHDKALIFRPKTVEVLQIGGYPISIVGGELLTLAACQANLDNLKEVADTRREQCESISIGDAVNDTRDHYSVKGIPPF
jgi:hypothetical protein